MNARNTIIRTTNSLSLATWFGGSLMGLVGVTRASSTAGGRGARAEGAAWSAWQPVQATAVVAQLVSGAALTVANSHRVVGQRGVATTSIARSALTGAAIGATVMAARAGRRFEEAETDRSDAEGGGGHHPEERRLRALQAAVPILTGAMIAMDALMGEQQRPNQVLRGTAQRFLPDALAERIAA